MQHVYFQLITGSSSSNSHLNLNCFNCSTGLIPWNSLFGL